MPSPAQLRAARVMLGLSQAEIAGRSCLSVPTVKRAEADAGVRVSDAVRAAITVVLKNAGVEFINGDEPGVKLKRPPRYEGLRSDQLNAETGNPRANVREKPSGAAPACEHALADRSRRGSAGNAFLGRPV
jgi:transcriptional regulator with XRE-family HTH domain